MSLFGAIWRRLRGDRAGARERVRTAAHDGPGSDPGAPSGDWFVSDEEREQERIVEQVCERLAAGVVRVDAKRRRLIWRPKRHALTLGASLRRLEGELPGCERDELEDAALYWLEQIATPENVTEEEMDRHEARIERWLDAYRERSDDD